MSAGNEGNERAAGNGHSQSSAPATSGSFRNFTVQVIIQTLGGFLAGVFLSLVAVQSCGKLRESERVVANLLPAQPLGDMLAFFVVTAPSGGATESVLIDEKFNIEIRSGELVPDSKQPYVKKITISSRSEEFPDLAARIAPVGGYYNTFDFPNMHCIFRVDLMTSEALYKNNQFIVAIGSFDRVDDPKPCRRLIRPI
jgi:hypothetical protein